MAIFGACVGCGACLICCVGRLAGALIPARSLQAECRTVWLLELAPRGQAFNVAHTRISPDSWQGDPHFLEPQASALRDLSRIIFASNMGGEFVKSDIVDVTAFGIKLRLDAALPSRDALPHLR